MGIMVCSARVRWLGHESFFTCPLGCKNHQWSFDLMVLGPTNFPAPVLVLLGLSQHSDHPFFCAFFWPVSIQVFCQSTHKILGTSLLSLFLEFRHQSTLDPPFSSGQIISSYPTWLWQAIITHISLNYSPSFNYSYVIPLPFSGCIDLWDEFNDSSLHWSCWDTFAFFWVCMFLVHCWIRLRASVYLLYFLFSKQCPQGAMIFSCARFKVHSKASCTTVRCACLSLHLEIYYYYGHTSTLPHRLISSICQQQGAIPEVQGMMAPMLRIP